MLRRNDDRNPVPWGTWALFGIAVIVIVLILIGVSARKQWFWGLL
jgi:hypothetical protein